MPDSTKDHQRKSILSSWRLGILITLVGTIGFLSSSSFEQGGEGRSTSLWTKLMSERTSGIIEADENEQTKPAQYINTNTTTTTSRLPGRLFRKYDETSQAANNQRPWSKSTYERSWPGYNLPSWARKVQRLRNFEPPSGHSICYVHVGKTAGSSIGCALGFRLHCNGKMQYLPGRLPKSATHAFHKDVYDCPVSSDYYLFVVRDPLARTRSAFVYGRPNEDGRSFEEKRWEDIKQIYLDCSFSTIHELAASGLAEDGGSSEECKQRARDMLRGEVRYEEHLFFNYQYYLESIPHNSKILIIRTEHMEEDWNDIELELGGRSRTNLTFPHSNSKQKEDRDYILGDEERLLLCHELCVEIQYYKILLRNAVNIDDLEYDTSMKELQASCPKEAMLKQCNFHTPNIKEKVLEAVPGK